MKKLNLNPFQVPRNLQELFPWLVKRLILSLGLGYVLGFAALLVVALSLLGFMIGDYKGTETGTVSDKNGNGGVTLDATTVAQNKVLLTYYEAAAAAWQKGISQAQIAQVQQQQVDLPGAVLLAVGKMINNMNPPNAADYYSYLKPTYTWQTYTNITIHYQTMNVKTKKGNVSKTKVTQTNTPVTMLTSAETWDGTLTDTYHWVTAMQGNTKNGVYSKAIHLDSFHRTYDWTPVWNLFKHFPTGSARHRYIIKDSAVNQETLAGFIGAVDYGISDPTIQKMVSTVLFPSGTSILGAGLGNLGPVAAPDKNTLHNVVRWKSYIEAAAQKYQIPAVLIAGVMYQESGGMQYGLDGSLLTSPTGAIGLMQVEPTTATGLIINGSPVGVNAIAYLANPEMNIELGAMYLSEMYHEFGDNPSEAESAYNAGEGAERVALGQGDTVAQNAQTLQYVQNIQESWVPKLEAYFG